MPTVRELLEEGKKLEAAGDLDGARRVASDIVLQRKVESYEGNVPKMAGHAAVRGVTGMGDLLSNVGGLISPSNLSSKIVSGFGGETPPPVSDSPVTDIAAKAGLTYGSEEELPQGMRPYAQGIETATGAFTPGGLVAAPLKMGANLLGKKAISSGLGFLGREGSAALGAGQMSTIAGLADPGDDITRAGAEIAGGVVGGPLGALGSLYRGAKNLGGRAVGAISGFMGGGKAVAGGTDELADITKQVLDRAGGSTSNLKDLITKLSTGKISPETKALYQTILANDDPAKGLSIILKSNKPDTQFGALVKAARRGKAGVVDELGNATIGSVWDNALTPDGAISFAKLKNGMFGGRNSVSKMLETHGVAKSDDLRTLQVLIDKGAELEKRGVDPKVAFDLAKELQQAAQRIVGAKGGSRISKAFGIGGIQMQALGSGMAVRAAKGGGLMSLLSNLNSKGPTGATEDAIKLRGYLLQALQTAIDDEEPR